MPTAKKEKKLTKTQRISRLKKLKYMLENHETIFAKPNQKGNLNGQMAFSISAWKDNFGRNFYILDHTDVALGKNADCGTAACALGSSAFYQPFRDLGLRYSRKDACPVYGRGDDRAEEFEAGERFFGISYDESLFLFSPSEYRQENIRYNRQKGKSWKTALKGECSKVYSSADYNLVTPHWVAKRVQKLIDHYSEFIQPLLFL